MNALIALIIQNCRMKVEFEYFEDFLPQIIFASYIHILLILSSSLLHSSRNSFYILEYPLSFVNEIIHFKGKNKCS